MIVPPIFVFCLEDGGTVDILASVPAAERHVESPDVSTVTYIDSAGKRLTPVVFGGGETECFPPFLRRIEIGKVTLRESDEPPDPDKLRQMLLQALQLCRVKADELPSEMSLCAVIAFAIKRLGVIF